jgi:nucleoside-diphosphate-sugar epimerase
MAEELHVLFGGGQVGQPLARILLGRGKRVRIVKRSAGGLPEGAERCHKSEFLCGGGAGSVDRVSLHESTVLRARMGRAVTAVH